MRPSSVIMRFHPTPLCPRWQTAPTTRRAAEGALAALAVESLNAKKGSKSSARSRETAFTWKKNRKIESEKYVSVLCKLRNLQSVALGWQGETAVAKQKQNRPSGSAD
jgi:hypothetical protein